MYKEINDLLEKAKEGDVRSKEVLLDKVKPLIIKQIQRYYNRKEEFEDLIQEGNLLVLECIEDYDEEKEVYFLGYIKAMLRFAYLNKHKIRIHQSLNTPVGEDGAEEIMDLLEGQEKSQEQLIIEEEESLEIRKILRKLTERQRKVIVLYYFKNMGIKDIAESLGISYRTVVNTKTRALEILRKEKNK